MKTPQEANVLALKIAYYLDSYPLDYFFVSQVAELFITNQAKVYELLKSGQLEGLKRNGIWEVNLKSVVEYAKANGYYAVLTPGWYTSKSSRRYFISQNGSTVRYGTQGGATRYCTIHDFVDWMEKG